MFIYNPSQVHSSLIQSVKEIVASYFFTLRMYLHLLTQLGRRSKSKKFPHQFRQSFPWGMNMNLWIFNLVCSAVYGINRISEPDLKAVSFAEKIAGQKLNGSLIKEIDVDSESSCQLQCVDEERCQSFNFGTQKGDSGKFKCQLSDSDRFVGFANFTEVENFIYRGIKVC